MKTASIINLCYFILLGVFLISSKYRQLLNKGVHIYKRNYASYLFVLAYALAFYLITVQLYSNYKLLVMVVILLIASIPILIMEIKYRKYKVIEVVSHISHDIEGLVEDSLMKNDIIFSKNNYAGLVETGIKYDLKSLPQKICLYDLSSTKTYRYKIHIKNYRALYGNEIIDSLIAGLQEAWDNRFYKKSLRGIIIEGAILSIATITCLFILYINIR